MKKLLILTIAAFAMASCASKMAQEPAAPKTLILCYSQNGTTLELANQLALFFSEADMEMIELEEPYDGDFDQTIARCRQEMEAGQVPTIKALGINPQDYDQIFLCYPVWFGTYASPVAGLLNQYDFSGKKIVTFCTFGSGGLQSSTEALRQALPTAEVVEGFGIRSARIKKVSDELRRFLIEHEMIEGQVEALPAFMEHHPVSAEEAEIFNQATAGYQFPLGTPVDVAGRESANSTDYEFTAQSQDPQGQTVTTTVYVTIDKAEGSQPEFTQVVR